MKLPAAGHRAYQRVRAAWSRGLTLRRTMLVVVFLGVVLPALVMVSIEQRISEQSQQIMLDQGKADVMAIGVASMVESMWVIDTAALREAADKLLTNPQVMAVRISENRPLAPPIMRSRTGVPAALAAQSSATLEHRLKPVVRDGERLGDLQVWFDTTYGRSLLAERRNQMTLLVVVQVAFSMAVLLMVLVRRVLHPIERLKDQATALALDVGSKPTMSWRRHDELGQLGRHLGKVQSQLAALFGELEQKNQQLQTLALYDQLTGLPNRSLFHDLVQRELMLARRNQHRFGLLFIDLDRFKAVNDSMGHGAGDAVLVRISHRLRSALRDVDVVCRQSGDEFLVMVRDLDHWERLGEVAERLLRAVETPVPLTDVPGNAHAQVSASIGIAVFPDDADDFETLVKHADIAMYQAKALGRARYSFFHVELNQRLQVNLELERALGAAIANDELVLHYQPQVDARTGRLIGVEALVRWQHPTRGLLYPGAFIGVAEECGKIADMGAWTLAAACHQMTQWAQRGIEVGRMSVNVSALEFRGHRLLENLQSVLASSGLDPSRLELEITESVLMTDTDSSQHIIDRVRSLGVGIAIDDFGTGYSSLAYLKRLRPTQLKVDQSFVRDLEQDVDSRAIVKGVLGLAAALGLSVVAEGVETPMQRQFLTEAGCPILQGYLIARPLPPAQLEAWIASHAQVHSVQTLT